MSKKQYLRQYSTTVHRTLDRAGLFTRHKWGPLRKYSRVLQTIRKRSRDFFSFFCPFKPSCHQKSSKVSPAALHMPISRSIIPPDFFFCRAMVLPASPSIPRDFIPLSYCISCPVRVYSFSPRRMKIWPLRRSFLASPALTGTSSRDSPNAS